MSQENVEIVRRVYVALSKGDVDTLRDLAVPEFVVDFSRRLVEPVVLRGLDEALAFFSQIRETWDDWPVWEPQELSDADDKVVAFIRTGARGRGSGVEIEAYVWNLWTLRDGKLVELSYFGDDQAAALEAAGLSEQAMSQEKVEIVRTVYEHWSQGNFRASADLLDPHVVLVLGPEFGPDSPATEAYHGAEGVADYTRGLLETWTPFTMEAEEIVAAGDSVLVGVHQRGVGSTSGVPTEMRYFTLWTFRGSTVIRLESFRERAEALEAAGLRG